MPDIMAWLLGASGALIALGVIWTKGLRPVWRFLRRVEDVHHLITDELPPFMQNTREWQTSTDAVLKQLQPNSGSSMFDRVKRIEQHLSLDVERRG